MNKDLAKLVAEAVDQGKVPPNQRALGEAERLLSVLAAFDVEPDRVVAAADGGVYLYHAMGGSYVLVDNDGSTVVVGAGQAPRAFAAPSRYVPEDDGGDL